MQPRSILFVTARLPFPLVSGDRVRAFHQVRLLARRHRVTLVTYADGASSEAAREVMEGHGIRLVTVPFDRLAAVWRVARCLWSDVPLQAALFDSPQLSDRIRDLVGREHFDLAHVQLARAVPPLGDYFGLPHVVDLVDALSLNMERRALKDRGPFRWAARIDAARLRAYERRICLDAGATTVVANADRDAIGEYPSLQVNPNGVDLSAFPFDGGRRDRRHLVFTGNLGYFPNVDAICWFVHHVMPLIWAREPAARLTIAGARPHARVRALAAHERRITVEGDVDHLHPRLVSAGVAVAPMMAGSGQLLKVLEAMSSGTPVVGTPRALSGTEARHGVHALTGDTPGALAAHVLSLIDDEALATRLSVAGRALVERLYTWDRSVADLEIIYNRVAGYDRVAAVCP
jgi:sugar transferase (PEP-CTERM/EpsH1 system associated)